MLAVRWQPSYLLLLLPTNTLIAVHYTFLSAYCLQATFPLLMLPHQHTHFCSLHSLNCILFAVRWQTTYLLLLLSHQHSHCCSQHNFNYILFTVCWQPTFPQLFLPHQHTHCCSLNNFNCIVLTVPDSQNSHCWYCTTNTHTAVQYTILTTYCLQSLIANIPAAVAAPPKHWLLFTTQF